MAKKFSSDFVGRVRNVNLPPSPANSLFPVFEAVSNSLHAIEDRFGSEDVNLGQIRIEIQRGADGCPENIVVSDNGIGLTDKNLDSFLTADSRHKLERGGKGIGRLSWLKAFHSASINSVFEDSNEKYLRNFKFELKDDPVSFSKEKKKTDEEIGTEVKLVNLRNDYASKIPKKLDTILGKIIGHFLPYFLTDDAPTLVIADKSELLELQSHLQHSITDSFTEALPVVLADHNSIEITIQHGKFDKGLSLSEKGYNFLFFVADKRVVEHVPIDNQLGLRSHGDGEVYVGVISSAFFDARANQERTALAIDESDLKSIRQVIDERVRIYLKDEIKEVRALQREKVLGVIRENPQFLPIQRELDEFIEEHLTLNKRDEEDIFLELSREKRRSRRTAFLKFTNAMKTGNESEIEKQSNRLLEKIHDEKKSSLAEYVVRRKSLLQLLHDRRSLKELDPEKHWLEEDIHGLICPLISSSDELSYEDHDLWIIDDRLAFFSYFASDKPFKSTRIPSDSAKEADLAFFERSLLFEGASSNDKIVIVEFKRPNRDDYTLADNPVEQILGYLGDLRDETKNSHDKNGALIDGISVNTRFTGYIIADLTKSLRSILDHYDFKGTPDGNGRFLIHQGLNAFVEVIPYTKLIADAEMRNAIFFEKLGLNDAN